MISFSVDKLVSDSKTGVVKSVEYHIKGNIGELQGVCNFSPPENMTNFTPFEQLTEETVWTWLKATSDHNLDTIDNPAIDLPAENYSIPW